MSIMIPDLKQGSLVLVKSKQEVSFNKIRTKINYLTDYTITDTFYKLSSLNIFKIKTNLKQDYTDNVSTFFDMSINNSIIYSSIINDYERIDSIYQDFNLFIKDKHYPFGIFTDSVIPIINNEYILTFLIKIIMFNGYFLSKKIWVLVNEDLKYI